MEFSVESSQDYIYEKKTKDIYKEVISCFINHNYRSTIVMLYTIVICDLIYKLQELRDIYQDEKANSILRDMEQKQNSNPTSPDWEDFLMKEIRDKTELLSLIEFDNIKQLKKYRNLSAHPVLNNRDILYSPSRELTLAQIRAMVEAVLAKPPLLSKKIIDDFLEDIESNKLFFLNADNECDTKSFKAFLKIRYFRFMGKSLKKSLFKALWKFVFIIDNADCDRNRDINFYALDCLYQESMDILKEYVKEEPQYFSFSGQYYPLIYIFLIKNPELFICFQDDVKITIRKVYENNEVVAKILGVFLAKDIETHCNKLEEFYKECTYHDDHLKTYLRLLYEYADKVCKKFVVLQCYIKIFSSAYSYQEAANRFRFFVEPYLRYMDGHEISMLIDSINSNRQIYESYDIERKISLVDVYAKKFFGEDYSTLLSGQGK